MVRYTVAILASAIPAYILGGVNGAIITSRIFFRKDIREYGSGNPGLTNFYRVFGKSGSLMVIAIDVFKTVAPVLFGGWLFGRFLDMSFLGRAISGVFVILGHCFPVFYKFKGGKGVMAAGAIVIFLDWRMAIISWGTFLLLTALTRYVSLGAMLGGATFPLTLVLFRIGGVWELVAVSMCSVLLIVRHEANIRRLIRGEESKFRIRKE